MNALGFAWRSLIRQPARASLGVLGVAAVGALLFDMLLLSNGLVTSMGDLLDRTGFDIRVGATDRPGRGPLIENARAAAARIATLPSVRNVITLRIADATVEFGDQRVQVSLQGTGGSRIHPWAVMRGRDLASPRDLLVNETAATTLRLVPGATVTLRAECARGNQSLPPVEFRVAGVATFPFDDGVDPAAATDAASLAGACGEDQADAAHIILVTSAGNPARAAADIASLVPELRAMTNDEVLGQLQATGFTYFRQISAVLTTVTVSFALLLIAVLLTVSVNQRLGEVAALRALGFSRRRVVSDVLCESALIVGMGGVLSLPLGLILARWLDSILKRMPGIPVDLHFFVFEPDALAVHAVILTTTAVLAAAYPMYLVSRLPIAATLRSEVIS